MRFDLAQLWRRPFLLFALDIIFLVSPGIAILYLHQNQAFLSLDWIKLLLLATAISAPFAFVTTLCLVGIESGASSQQKNPGEIDSFFRTLTEGILVAGLGLYLLLIIGFIWGISLPILLALAVCAQILALVIAFVIETIKSSRAK